MGRRYAASDAFLEHLNFKLGNPTATGLNTLVATDPGQVNARKLDIGLKMASDEELHYQRAKQKDANYQRQLHAWVYTDDAPAIPREMATYQQAYDLAASLDAKNVAKLIGGYGGIRGNKPTGKTGVELAADALYNASFGIDTLTGAPLDYKHNAGHLLDFNNHGQGPTRAEQSRVNKVTQDFDGMHKLMLIDDTRDDLKNAQMYAAAPEAMEELLLNELGSSRRESDGWSPELNKMKADALRWHLTK